MAHTPPCLAYLATIALVIHLLQNWKKMFFDKIFVFFTKYTSFYIKKHFCWEKLFFYREKYKWKCKNIYLIWKIYFYTENVCVTNKI